jgi:hypothetical protein
MKVRFEIQLSGDATGSPVVTDGQRRTISISVLTACMGFRTQPRMVSKSRSQTVIRRLLRLARGPFRYRRYAASRRSGDMGYDVRFRRRGAPVQATVADDSLCQ